MVDTFLAGLRRYGGRRCSVCGELFYVPEALAKHFQEHKLAAMVAAELSSSEEGGDDQDDGRDGGGGREPR